MPIKLKSVKVDIKWSERKADAEKAAKAAATPLLGKAKVAKDYEIALNVKVEHDPKNGAKSSCTFLLTEGGKLVPNVSMSKSGSVAVSFSGDVPPAKVVAESVDGAVSNMLETLVKTLEKLK
jgi:hypothetical protein